MRVYKKEAHSVVGVRSAVYAWEARSGTHAKMCGRKDTKHHAIKKGVVGLELHQGLYGLSCSESSAHTSFGTRSPASSAAAPSAEAKVTTTRVSKSCSCWIISPEFVPPPVLLRVARACRFSLSFLFLLLGLSAAPAAAAAF
jgi:hypothetical protein